MLFGKRALGNIKCWPTRATFMAWVLGFALNTLSAQAQSTPQNSGFSNTSSLGCSESPDLQRLQLQEAITLAACLNPSIREAFEVVLQNRAAVAVARTAFLPNVEASAHVERGHYSNKVNDFSFEDLTSRLQNSSAQLSLQWTIYDFGQRKTAVQNQVAELLGAAFNQTAQIQQVFLSTSSAWIQLSTAFSVHQVRQRSLEDDVQLLAAAHARRVFGAASAADELQAATLVVQGQINIRNAEKDVLDGKAKLAQTIGLTSRDFSVIGTALQADVPDLPLDALRILIHQAIDLAPDILVAKQNIQIAESALRQAQASESPTVSLIGSASSSDEFPSVQFRERTHESNASYSGGLEIDIPISQFAYRGPRISEARAVYEQRKSAFEAAKQSVEQRVWMFFNAVAEDQKSVGLAKAGETVARAAYVAVLERYKAGITDITSTIQAEDRLESARLSRAQLSGDLYTGQLSLLATLGVIKAPVQNLDQSSYAGGHH